MSYPPPNDPNAYPPGGQPPYGSPQPPYGSPQPHYGTPPPYSTPGYGPAPAGGPKPDGMAIASMVTSIVGVLLTCCYIGIIGSVVGLVLGLVSRKRINESDGALGGAGMALTGIIVGAVGIALFAGWLALLITSDGTTTYRYYR